MEYVKETGLTGQKKRLKPSVEWADPAVPEYESAVGSTGEPLVRASAVADVADADADLDTKEAAKRIIRGGVK